METRNTAPDIWINEIFSAKAAANGGVIRRNRLWVENEVGRDRFIAEVRKRGFHLLETGQQLIVICHRGAVHMHF
ncbi:MAG: hypothetical protein RLZZ437_3095 [Pseudomonadota bacterium]|jgi:hypothetical protein